MQVIFDGGKLRLVLTGVFINNIDYTFDHFLLADFFSDNAQLRPVCTCPYLHNSPLVDADVLGVYSEAAEDGGELAKSLEALVVGMDGIGVGEILEVGDTNGHLFDEDVGDGSGYTELFAAFLFEIESGYPARVVFPAVI